MVILYVTVDELDVVPLENREVELRAPSMEVVEDHDGHPRMSCFKGQGKGGTNKTRTTCNEYLHILLPTDMEVSTGATRKLVRSGNDLTQIRTRIVRSAP